MNLAKFVEAIMNFAHAAKEEINPTSPFLTTERITLDPKTLMFHRTNFQTGETLEEPFRLIRNRNGEMRKLTRQGNLLSVR